MPHDQSPETVFHEREQLRVTLASIGDGVITTDAAGNVTFLNPVAEQLTGWSNADAAGAALSTVFKIVNEETRHDVENPALRALRQGLVVGLANHTLLIAKDGVERPIDDSAAPIFDPQGKIVGVVLVFRDVSERREAERALKLSEERFRLLVDCVQDYAIFMLDPQGRVVSWNAGAERIKGYSADEIIGKHFSIFYPPEAIELNWPQKELELATEQGRFEDEGWRLRKDGTKLWANVTITAIRDEHGQLRGFAKITRDLTQRRQMERLKMQAEVLADLDRRKDEFLAMLSHELRNPLSPIINAVHLLRREREEGAQSQAIGIIERQVGQVTRLIDDLLEVSRITTGRIRLELEHVDLRTIAERARDAVRSLVGRKRQQLTISLPAEPVWLYADAARLEQCLVNLLNNASKYSDERTTIDLAVEQSGSEALARVRDQGIGIATELLPRVFDLFTQGERSLDRAQGGLGVGLTIVQRIVQMHGGNVEAFSHGLGKGSEFVIRLPVLAPPASQAPHTPSATGTPAEAPAGLRVLVVDDNKDAADSTALLLRYSGHDVRVAYSGMTGLQSALDFHPHAMLLDIGLPEIDGYEVARRLRKNPVGRNVHLIAVSGYGQEGDRKKSHEAGFDAHLVKPVSPQKIDEILASLPR